MLNNNTETRICKMCRSEIHIDALKCPYCHHFQKKLIFISSISNFIPLINVALLFLSIIFIGFTFEKLFINGNIFADHRNEISIIQSELKHGETKNGDNRVPTIVIIGKIKNNGLVNWDNIAIEVDIFDNQGKIVDTSIGEKYTYQCSAKDQSSFKISFHRQFPVEFYASHKVRILSANDSRKIF